MGVSFPKVGVRAMAIAWSRAYCLAGKSDQVGDEHLSVRRICHHQQPSLLHPAALLSSCWWLQVCRLQHTCLLGSYVSMGTLSLSCLKRHPSLIFLQRMGLPGDLVLMVLGCSVSRGRSLLSFSITGFLISQGPVSGQNRISSCKLLGLFFKIWPCPIITVCLWTSQESRASDLMAKTYLPTETTEKKAIFLKVWATRGNFI